GHDPRVDAIAALRHLLGDECHLQRMRLVRRTEPGEGRDLSAGRRRYWQRARPGRRAVDMDGTGAALRKAAAEMRVAEPKLVAQHVEKRRIRRDLDGSGFSVQLEGDALCHFEALLDLGMSSSVGRG